MSKFRLSRTEDHVFVKPAGTLNVVNDRDMLYKPGLYGWNMNNPAIHFEPEEYESELAFVQGSILEDNNKE